MRCSHFSHAIEVNIRVFSPFSTCISDIFLKFFVGYRLSGHVISEHNTLNFLECSLYCLRKPFGCKSINYKARKHQHPSTNCQLNNATKTKHPQNLQADKNYDYYEPLHGKGIFYRFSVNMENKVIWASNTFLCSFTNKRRC